MNGQKGNTMYKYYLFDLDGTISQSEPGILNCIRYALDAAGLPEPSEKVLKTFIGPSLYDSFTSNVMLTTIRHSGWWTNTENDIT